MLSIRLKRIGKPKKAFYRIIVIEKARDPYGNPADTIGTYDPHTKEVKIDADKVKDWIAKGAQPSPTVHNLLVDQKIIEGEKVVASKSKPGKKKREATAAKQADGDKEKGEKKEDPTEGDAKEAPAEDKKGDAPTEEAKPEEKQDEASKEEAAPAKEEKKVE